MEAMGKLGVKDVNAVMQVEEKLRKLAGAGRKGEKVYGVLWPNKRERGGNGRGRKAREQKAGGGAGEAAGTPTQQQKEAYQRIMARDENTSPNQNCMRTPRTCLEPHQAKVNPSNLITAADGEHDETATGMGEVVIGMRPGTHRKNMGFSSIAKGLIEAPLTIETGTKRPPLHTTKPLPPQPDGTTLHNNRPS